MRFLKIFLLTVVITLLGLSVVLTISYSQRLAIINNIAAAQLNTYQAKITCLNFHFTSPMKIIVDKLCLENTKVNIDIKDTTIQWQLSPSPKISSVKISLLNVKAVAPLFEQNNLPSTASNELNLTQWLSLTLTPYIDQITQLQLPTKINVKQFSYLPFLSKNTTTPYFGNFDASANRLSFSLESPTNKELINADLTVNQDGFVMELSSELTQLKHFASIHQLPITTALQDALSATDISGRLNTHIEYQTGTLIIKNKVPNIIISSINGIKNSGTFKIIGALNFRTKLPLTSLSPSNGKAISLMFLEKNEFTLDYDQQHLLTLLKTYNATEQVISLLKDNPLTQLTITLKDNTVLAVNNEQVSLSSMELSAQSDDRSHKILLEDMVLNFPLNRQNDFYYFSVNNFNLDSSLNLTSLTSLTTEPVKVQLAGAFNKSEKQTALTLFEPSSITVKHLKVSEVPNKGSTKTSPPLLAIKAIETKLKGSIVLQENNTLRLNINADSQALQLNMPKVAQLKTFNIFSHIQGDLNNININATTSADKVALGKIVVTGSVQSPKVEMSGNQLQMTDLLALHLKLPVEVTLIDGLLDYNVIGQLTDLSNLANNKINATIAVTSLSGEVDGIWLQELNWHQQLTLLAGKVTGLINTDTENNLTIALIDTPTPVSDLSSRIEFTYDDNFSVTASTLKGNVLGGSFSVPQIQWPLKQGHSVDVQLSSIDLEQVLALDKKQGIVVTGNISGQLPILFDGKQFTIANGKLFNINNGLIQVVNNPAIAQLKTNNSELELAFDALQNLHYHQLSSAVSIADDGYMLLETVIKGRNPDIDNDVNLNLNLSYDLPGLLESLSITERFEKNIIKGLKTH